MRLIDDFEGFVFDFDGVLWLGNKLVPGADRVVNMIRESGKKIVFLTNNASRSREDYVVKLEGFGIEAFSQEVVTSGSIAGEHILNAFGPSRIYVVGMSGLVSELSGFGHRVVEKDPGFVVVGMDESFSYEKLEKAFHFVHYDGARLIAANDDRVAVRDDFLVPVAGSILSSIEVACNVKAEVMGKPYKPSIEVVASKLDLKPESVLVVGDSLSSDIAFGAGAGFKTCLVLSGVDGEKDLASSDVNPDFVLSDVSKLINPK